jgi:hypothetical protein
VPEQLSNPTDAPAQAEWALTRTVPINNRLTVTMTCGPGGFVCEWSPATPSFKQLKKWERKRYRAGRNALLAEVAERIGGNVLVLEV